MYRLEVRSKHFVIFNKKNVKKIEICERQYITNLRGPEQLVPPPERDVFVVAGGGEHLVVRMHGEAPELPAVAEDDLVEAPL